MNRGRSVPVRPESSPEDRDPAPHSIGWLSRGTEIGSPADLTEKAAEWPRWLQPGVPPGWRSRA